MKKLILVTAVCSLITIGAVSAQEGGMTMTANIVRPPAAVEPPAEPEPAVAVETPAEPPVEAPAPEPVTNTCN